MTSQVTSYRWCPCYLADYVDTGVHKSFFGGGIPRSNDARCSVCMKQCVCETFVAVNVPTGSRGGDVAVYVFDVNQPSLPTPFHSVLVSISAFMALSTVFHSINSPTTLHFLTSFLRSYFCLIGPFNYISLYESLLQPRYNTCGCLGLKHQLTN